MEYHNPTLRVLRILELIDANSGGLSLSEISSLLDLPKGTISPILKTLSATNYIVADGSLYKIGPHTFELGLSYASGQNALSIIRSEMRSIVSKVDEVCQMGVLIGQDVHYLLKEEGHAIISIISEVGHHLPAHVTGLGKALLSGLPDAELCEKIRGTKLPTYTSRSITDPEALIKEIRLIRQRGWSRDDQEHEPGIRCIAAPIYDYRGNIVAAVSTSGLKQIITPARDEEIAGFVMDAAHSISQRMGYRD